MTNWYTVPSSAREAQRFHNINWITSKEGQEFIVKNGGRIPVRTDVEPDPPKLTKGLKLDLAKRLEGKEFNDIQALYRRIWHGL